MASIPACAQKCYNGDQPSYGCNFYDTACYCKQSVATQLVSCAQGNCDQTDLQSFITWAQEACAGVGVTFDASAPSATAQNQAITSSITSSPTSIDASSKSTAPSSDNGSVSSSGLATSDKITIGIGVPGGVFAILGVWFAWKRYKRDKNKDRTKVIL